MFLFVLLCAEEGEKNNIHMNMKIEKGRRV